MVRNGLFVVLDGSSLVETGGHSLADAFGALPNFCPFDNLMRYLNTSASGVGKFLGMLNWFVPIAEMVVVLEIWGTAIVIWYLASIALRWVKAIE
jgi:hypothetical protein